MSIAEKILRAKADYDSVYKAGYENGKYILYGTYLFKEILSSEKLPKKDFSHFFPPARTAYLYLRKSDTEYYFTEISAITLNATQEPKIKITARTYSGIKLGGFNEYDSSKNQWFSNFSNSGVVSTYEGNAKTRVIKFIEPVTVPQEFYEAFTLLLDEDSNIYDEGFDIGVEQGLTEGIEQGKQAQYDEFEAEYTRNGKRTNWQYAYAGIGWTDNTFKPGHDIILGGGYSGTSMFQQSSITNIAETLEKLGRKFDTSKCGYFSSMFSGAKSVRIPTIDLSNSHTYPSSTYVMFANCAAKIIDKLIVNEQTTFASSTFQACANLEEIRFEGEIGQNGLNFKDCTKLSKASWINIVGCYSTTISGLSMTGSLASVNSAFATSEGANDGSTSAEWLNLIATRPNVTFNLI